MKIKNKRGKSLLKRVINKLLLIIILLIVVYNLIYFVSGLLKTRWSFFGINFFEVDSNAMRPMLEQKDIIVTQKTSPKDLNPEDVILCLKDNKYIIRRVLNVKETRGRYSVIARGDNTYYIEEILEEDVYAKMTSKVSAGKFLINIARSKVLTGIIFIFLLLFMWVQYSYRRNLKLKKERRNKLNKSIK